MPDYALVNALLVDRLLVYNIVEINLIKDYCTLTFSSVQTMDRRRYKLLLH